MFLLTLCVAYSGTQISQYVGLTRFRFFLLFPLPNTSLLFFKVLVRVKILSRSVISCTSLLPDPASRCREAGSSLLFSFNYYLEYGAHTCTILVPILCFKMSYDGVGDNHYIVVKELTGKRFWVLNYLHHVLPAASLFYVSEHILQLASCRKSIETCISSLLCGSKLDHP